MLVPLVNQFGLMQQQMFDQFHQAMAMMVQMFGTMHHDQMAVIREELDRLNELSDEVHALRAELAGRTQDDDPNVSSEPGRRHTRHCLGKSPWNRPFPATGSNRNRAQPEGSGRRCE